MTTPPETLIIERPPDSFACEHRRLPPDTFRFAYADRPWPAPHPRSLAYDTRYAQLYRWKHAWIAGWWDSYYGWVCHPYWVKLKPTRPYHHPWVVADETGQCDAGSFEQRKPIDPAHQNGCWYAIGFTSDDAPPEPETETWMVMEERLQTLPAQPMAIGLNPITSLLALGEDAYQFALSRIGRALLELPLGTLAGLSKRTTPPRIAAWAWYAARWMGAVADESFDPTEPRDLLYALHTFKQDVMFTEEFVPLAVRRALTEPILKPPLD